MNSELFKKQIDILDILESRIKSGEESDIFIFNSQ